MKTGNLISLILIIGLIGQGQLSSQEVQQFSLKDAQIYALENSYDIINAKTDVEIANKKVKETTAIGFPQVSGVVGYQNNIEIPTQLIPGDFFGQPGTFQEIQFGTQHNANFGATVNQILFNGQYVVGLMATKAYLSLSETGLLKTKIEVDNAIAKAYYPVVILKENQIVFDSTLVSMKRMLYETNEYYENGFLEDLDVDQIELLVSDMETTITNLNSQLELGYAVLKFTMGINANEQIEVTDKIDDLLDEINKEYLLNSPFDFSHNIDYLMLKNEERIAQLDLKLKKSEYLPNLNAFYNYQGNAMRDKFDFFDGSQKWYSSQMLGIQLDVPIFSSGIRKNKVQQASLELEKLKVRDNQLQQRLALEVETARSLFNNSYLVYLNRKKSFLQAEKIYQKTEIKYREGLSTSLELSQTYNQYLQAQISYLTSIQDVFNYKADLDKVLTRTSR
jgi:outer membrane protein TolC